MSANDSEQSWTKRVDPSFEDLELRRQIRKLPEPGSPKVQTIAVAAAEATGSKHSDLVGAYSSYLNTYSKAYRAALEVVIHGHTDNAGYDALLAGRDMVTVAHAQMRMKSEEDTRVALSDREGELKASLVRQEVLEVVTLFDKAAKKDRVFLAAQFEALEQNLPGKTTGR